MHPHAVTTKPSAGARLGLAALCFGLLAWSLAAAPPARGAALGLQAGTSISANDENFYQVELTADWAMPWSWHWGGWVQVETRLSATAGALVGDGRAAAMGTIGPVFAFSTDGGRWEITAGSSLTFLSRHRFDEEDLGGFLQFTHHVAWRWRLTDAAGLGLRVQHMSNADLYDDNPGLDMAMITVDWRF